MGGTAIFGISADSAGFSLDNPSCSPFAEQARGVAK